MAVKNRCLCSIVHGISGMTAVAAKSISSFVRTLSLKHPSFSNVVFLIAEQTFEQRRFLFQVSADLLSFCAGTVQGNCNFL